MKPLPWAGDLAIHSLSRAIVDLVHDADLDVASSFSAINGAILALARSLDVPDATTVAMLTAGLTQLAADNPQPQEAMQ